MDNIQYKKYLLSDLSNLIIKYDKGITNKLRIEIVLLLMEQESQYILSIYLPEHDGPVDLPISYGNIKKKGDIVYLNDVLSGVQIVLKEDKPNTLSCCRGFYFLTGKEFVYKLSESIDKKYLSVDFEKGKSIRTKREHLYENEKSEEAVPLQLGVYGHQLILEMNFQYQQFFDTGFGFHCLISRGTWEKKGNALNLYDPDLKYSFLLLIRKDDLIRIRYQEEEGNYFLIRSRDQMFPFIMR